MSIGRDQALLVIVTLKAGVFFRLSPPRHFPSILALPPSLKSDLMECQCQKVNSQALIKKIQELSSDLDSGSCIRVETRGNCRIQQVSWPAEES